MINKICGVIFLVSAVALIGGCRGGGGGDGSSSISGNSSYSTSYTGSGNNDTVNLLAYSEDTGIEGSTTELSTELATVHNPEPSSLLLFGSGLMGMAVYARSKLRGKRKK